MIRRQTINSINKGLVYQRLYRPLCFDELNMYVAVGHNKISRRDRAEHVGVIKLDGLLSRQKIGAHR